jgi:hypothetical protein
VNNKYIRLLAISLVIVVVLSFVQDFGDFLDQRSDKLVRLGVNTQCKPTQGICSAAIIENGESKRISISIIGPVIKQKKFPVNIKASGFEFEGIQSVVVSFEMLDADLELNRVSFSPVRHQDQIVPQHWTAEVMLPVGSEQRSDWIAIVTLTSSEKVYQAEFPFNQTRQYSVQSTEL